MTSREAFVVGVRLLGLWVLIEAPGTLISMQQGDSSLRGNSLQLFTYGSGALLVGVYLLGGAPLLVRLFLGREKPPSEPPREG